MTLGGDDQLRVIPHLDREAMLADPKPFLGYSDNTNLLNWLWCAGVGEYNPDAVVCVGVPFGHTSPQWIVPCGGRVTLDGGRRRVFADYGRP